MPRKKYNVTAEAFVRAWTSAATLDEVAKALGMPREIAAARAGHYRTQGVRLKRMPNRRNQIDVARLNAAVEDEERKA